MKALLWLVLIAALAVNVSTSIVFDGVEQVLISIGTGLAALATGVTLFMLRHRDA